MSGVSANEVVDVGEGQGHFQYQKIPRECFTMYPEETLGVGLQSASIMWEHVEELFIGIRDVMMKNLLF